MIIMKFGGSSLANAERIRHVGKIIAASFHRKPIIVVSAIGKTTDNLIECGRLALSSRIDLQKITDLHTTIAADLGLQGDDVDELIGDLERLLLGISSRKELTLPAMDYLLSFGERLSSRLVSAYLRQYGIESVPIDGWDAGLVTTSNFTCAEILPQTYDAIPAAFENLRTVIPVVTGFIAKDVHGSITTLGRGGSDLTASVIGAALRVQEIQVWKDVHGILSADPRVLERALPIPSISFEAASELAYFGAKVLHSMSIVPAMQKGIPVRVKNSYDPDHSGTIITSSSTSGCAFAAAIAHKSHQTLVRMRSTRMLSQWSFISRIFQVLEELNFAADIAAVSSVNVSLILKNREELEVLKSRVHGIAAVATQESVSVVSIIGDSNRLDQILEQSVKTLLESDVKVHMALYGASMSSVNVVVEDREVQESIHLLHERFFQQRRSL